jgi:branched-subunit amino acid ABC-type transport system permease component
LLFAVFDAETVAQLTANGIFRGAAYGILGVGFALILGVTGQFHFAYAFTYTLAAYMAYTFVDRVGGMPFWFASMLGVVLVAFVGTGIERFVYRPLADRAGATALLAIFVASLGITIAGENLIRLFWSSSSQNLVGPDEIAYSIWEVNFLNFDVWQAVSSFGCVVVLAVLLRYTPLGRAIKATRANPELARTIGIDAGQIYLVCFCAQRADAQPRRHVDRDRVARGPGRRLRRRRPVGLPVRGGALKVVNATGAPVNPIAIK